MRGEIVLRNSYEKLYIKILVALTYIGMISVNALANILPINGRTTGEISDYYANLFAPAGYTFIIWGFIYLLLGLFTLYQIGLFRNKSVQRRDGLLNKVGFYFAVSSIANIFWILAWHYDYIGLSVLIMLVILFSLISINKLTKKTELTLKEKFFIRFPFSVYFGWITIATIANIITWLVSIHWNGFGISEVIWTVIILFVGILIGVLNIFRYRNIYYGLVIIWAYVGILQKHISQAGFAGQYPVIIGTVGACIAICAVTMIYFAIDCRRSSIW